jgi:sugar lactone lactonase YvrE
MKKPALVVLALITLPLAYLLLWPVPIDPVSWAAPTPPGYAGPHTANDKLKGLTLIALPPGESGPEHVAVGPDGALYAAVASGKVLRLGADGNAAEIVADTGGRVLGFAWDGAGRLIAADALKGLLAINPDRTVTVLAASADGEPIRYADAVVVAKNGLIYFSDASLRFGPASAGSTYEAAVLDIVEQRCTGRVLVHDPATKGTHTILRGLCFANGVALSRDERHLFVAETGNYRVWKVAIAGTMHLDMQKKPSPQAQLLFDNLPGYPDNLMRGDKGRIWLAFSGPRSPTVDAMADEPWLRRLTLRLPRALWPVPKPYGHVMAFDESGRVLVDLQDPSGAYPETTGVTETADRLYIQNLHNSVLGWMPKRQAGLD